MFRITVTCDDNKLPRVLLGLAGLIHSNPEVVPVINAEVKRNGQVKEQIKGAQMFDLFKEQLLKQKNVTQVKADDIRDFLNAHGRPPTSYSYLLQLAQKNGLLKKKGKGAGSVYTVVRP